MSDAPDATMLQGVRVIEVADEQAEYTGLLLAGLGGEVIKVEPPGGSATRCGGSRPVATCSRRAGDGLLCYDLVRV